MNMRKDIEGTAASYSAINAYIVLVLGFVGLKTAFSKEIIDFFPIFLAVLLLILNNSVKYYNAVPCRLALLLSLGLTIFLCYTTYEHGTDDLSKIIRLGIMALSGFPAIFFIVRLVIHRF